MPSFYPTTCAAWLGAQATGKWFVMDASFALGDLLKLELHNYVDACAGIVDRAQKELIIEKALAHIEDAWGRFTLTFAPYQVSNTHSLGPSIPLT